MQTGWKNANMAHIPILDIIRFRNTWKLYELSNGHWMLCCIFTFSPIWWIALAFSFTFTQPSIRAYFYLVFFTIFVFARNSSFIFLFYVCLFFLFISFHKIWAKYNGQVGGPPIKQRKFKKKRKNDETMANNQQEGDENREVTESLLEGANKGKQIK